MPSWPRAVLFDFDGVLVNSEPLHYQAFREVLAKEGIVLTEEQYYRDLIGLDDRGAFRFAYGLHSKVLTPRKFLQLMAEKTLVMRDLVYRRKMTTLPGVGELVRQLWRRIPLAIVSGAMHEEIEVMLEGVALRDCFGTIIGSEDVTAGKPNPQGYLMAMRQISDRLMHEGKIEHALTPADCLVVEDAPTVVHSVVKVGFPTLAVCNTYGPEQLADAKYIVDSLQPAEVRAKVPALGLKE
ncbi:HAD family hydrolase [Humisphaera borealis]|uniref:HAD family phosphatase n=1 Tax=Humisphaera borealis TaxID=2807512 RepID=A0A7M2WRE7_9BACT|nr:HAD family phosphatase [Humisphaera borealis]QOV88088.1 HAD family phosphatase [Humisphaera borealis]